MVCEKSIDSKKELDKKGKFKKLRNNKKRKIKHGFTLIELLAVIVILGLLMAIAIPSVTKYITQSRKKTVTTTIGNYASASLTNHNQLKTLGCTYTENGNCYDCNNSPYTFVKCEENSWWTGSSINHIRIWYHDQTGACNWNYYYSTQGLRPTVTISKDEINFN